MTLKEILLCTATLFLLQIVRAIYSAWTSPLRDVPGPTYAQYTRLWYFVNVSRGRFHEQNLELHRKYAKPGEYHARIVRLAPNHYSIASPEKVIYGIASKLPKGTWYEGWHIPNNKPGLFQQRDMKKHAEEKRKISSLYSVSNLTVYEPRVEHSLSLFLSRLSEFADGGKTIDMADWFQFWAFDTIGLLTYSKVFGFLGQGFDVNGICAAVHQSTVYCTLAGIFPRIHPFLFRILASVPGAGASGTKFIIEMAVNTIRERAAERRSGVDGQEDGKKVLGDNNSKDFLDKAMEMSESNDGSISGPAVDRIRSMSLQNLFAGSDTTAISSASILFCLLRNPGCLAKLREEIASCSDSGEVTFKQAQRLPYLQACIKEGLRLHAATGLPLWRTVPAGGAEIYGRFFPAGTEVGLNVWVPHRDRDVWGPDADEFRPERWIGVEGTQDQRDMDAYYMPFGLGSRTCIGKNISLLEISKLFPRLVMNFDFELERSEWNWTTENLWFVKPVGFKLRVRHRRGVAN